MAGAERWYQDGFNPGFTGAGVQDGAAAWFAAGAPSSAMSLPSGCNCGSVLTSALGVSAGGDVPARPVISGGVIVETPTSDTASRKWLSFDSEKDGPPA